MTTVKVYKTNVNDQSTAQKILDEIQQMLICDPSFDLEDCDKVLRIEKSTEIDETRVRNILNQHGYKMQKLL